MDYGQGSEVVLDGMPTYYWWGGCTPTSGGMIIGYWNDPALYPLYNGDATVWSGASYNSDGTAPTGTAAMVASWDHVREGELHDPPYDTSHGCGKYTPSERDANCIADFMGTENGNTGAGGIYGLEEFAAWDNPDTPDFNESVDATCTGSYYRWISMDVWSDFKAEIDAGRPAVMMLSRSGGGGHSVAAYGYLDNSGTDNDFFAVKDTWPSGANSKDPPGRYFDDGVEWWPWKPYDGTYDSTYDWRVDFMVTFYAEPVPEPTTMALLGIGVAVIGFRIRRHRKGHSRE